MVFDRLPLVGATESDVRGWLGVPNGSDGDGWDYTRGNGEIAAIHVVRFKEDVVVGVDHFPSQ